MIEEPNLRQKHLDELARKTIKKANSPGQSDRP
jgi:hypothetical protein